MLSIVVPIFNEQKNIAPLYTELTLVLNKLGKPYEIICVDDGSKDNSLEELKSIHKKALEETLGKPLL